MKHFIAIILVFFVTITNAQAARLTATWDLTASMDGTTTLVGPNKTPIRLVFIQTMNDLRVVDGHLTGTALFQVYEQYDGYEKISLPFRTYAIGTFKYNDPVVFFKPEDDLFYRIKTMFLKSLCTLFSNPKTAFSSTKANVVWDWFIMPDGTSIDLAKINDPP